MPDPLANTFIDLALPQEIRLAAAIVAGNTPAIGQIFKEWNKTPPSLLSSVATVLAALTKTLNIPFSAPEISMIETAAALAAEENKNPYHSNTHFLKVFVLSAFLGADAYKDRRIDAHNFSILLSAALIHDYKHDGSYNKGQRYRLENISLAAAEGAMKQSGATDKDWELLTAFLHTTDVSKDFSAPLSLSPSDTVKRYSISGNKDDLLPELQILADTGTADIAMMLEDADLAGGLLDVQLSIESGKALAAEQGRLYDVPSEKYFLEHICHKQMFSMSGKRLIQPHMNEVLEYFGLQPPPQGLSIPPP